MDVMTEIANLFESANQLTPVGLIAVVVVAIVGVAYMGQRLTRSMNQITEKQIEAMQSQQRQENVIQTRLLDYLTHLSNGINTMAEATRAQERMLSSKLDIFVSRLGELSETQAGIVSLMSSLHDDNRAANDRIAETSSGIGKLDKGIIGLTKAVTDVADRLERLLSDHEDTVRMHYADMDVRFAKLEQILQGTRDNMRVLEQLTREIERSIKAHEVITKPIPEAQLMKEGQTDGIDRSDF